MNVGYLPNTMRNLINLEVVNLNKNNFTGMKGLGSIKTEDVTMFVLLMAKVGKIIDGEGMLYHAYIQSLFFDFCIVFD